MAGKKDDLYRKYCAECDEDVIGPDLKSVEETFSRHQKKRHKKSERPSSSGLRKSRTS